MLPFNPLGPADDTLTEQALYHLDAARGLTATPNDFVAMAELRHHTVMAGALSQLAVAEQLSLLLDAVTRIAEGMGWVEPTS